jgi:hypothetical protein
MHFAGQTQNSTPQRMHRCSGVRGQLLQRESNRHTGSWRHLFLRPIMMSLFCPAGGWVAGRVSHDCLAEDVVCAGALALESQPKSARWMKRFRWVEPRGHPRFL